VSSAKRWKTVKRQAEKSGEPIDLEGLSGELPARTPGGMIPPEAVRFLKANASDPAIQEQFRLKYRVDPNAFLR
jgi:hypothetical protein